MTTATQELIKATTFEEIERQFNTEYENFEARPQRGITIVEIREFIGEDFGNNAGNQYKVWKFRAYFYKLAHSVKQFEPEKGNGTKGILRLSKNPLESVIQAKNESGIKDLPFTVAINRYGAVDRPFYISEIITEEEAQDFRHMKDLDIIEQIPKFKQKREQLEKRREYEKRKREGIIKKYFEKRNLPLTFCLYKFLVKNVEGEVTEEKIEEVLNTKCYNRKGEWRPLNAPTDDYENLKEDYGLIVKPKDDEI